MWRASPDCAGMEDSAMTNAVGGGDGGVYAGGGRRDLTASMIEAPPDLLNFELFEELGKSILMFLVFVPN